MPLGALLLLSLLGDPTSTVAASKVGFQRYQPLSIRQLYEKRMRFDRREPMISVGLVDGQTEVQLSATGPLRVMFDDGDLPKTHYAAAGERFVFRRSTGRPAEVMYWVIIGVAPPGKKQQLEEEVHPWSTKGHRAQLFETGAVVGLRGNVLDTRQWELGLGGFTDRAAAEALMRKLTRDGLSQLFLHEELVAPPRGVITIQDGRGELLGRAQDAVYVGTVAGARVKVSSVEFNRGYHNHGREDREYEGHLYVVIDGKGKLAAVNSVGAETLLAGLVPAEIFAKAALEALKAQAVTARGEIFSKLAHRHFGDPFHLCSEQHCQVYSGAKAQQPSTDQAVVETRGLLAFRPRQAGTEPLVLVDSVYSASCGGFAESSDAVWGAPPSDSLPAHADAFGEDPAFERFREGLSDDNLRAFLEAYPPAACARASFADPKRYRWKRTFSQKELDAIVASLGIGRLLSADVLARGRGGRVTRLRLVGTRGATEILRELPVRRLFKNLNSGLFVLDQEQDPRGEVTSLTFTGGGWGHGVGMCQMGAIGRAERGQDFRKILAHYYGGAVVEQIYD